MVHENNFFVVQFPSKAELQRSLNYDRADVMVNGIAIGA